MRSRTRFGLIVSAIVFFGLGAGALLLTVQRTFDSVVSSPSADGSYQTPSQTSQWISTLLPVSAAVFMVVSLICAAGAVASFVVTEGIERAAAARTDVAAHRSEPAGEVLDSHGPGDSAA
jgi:hypothetical protein